MINRLIAPRVLDYNKIIIMKITSFCRSFLKCNQLSEKLPDKIWFIKRLLSPNFLIKNVISSLIRHKWLGWLHENAFSGSPTIDVTDLTICLLHVIVNDANNFRMSDNFLLGFHCVLYI